MSKQIKLYIAFAILVLLPLLISPIAVFARAGGGESFDTGGFDVSSSFDTFDSGSSSFDSFDSGTYTGDGGFDCTSVLFILVVIIIIVAIAKKKGGNRPPTGGNTPTKVINSNIGTNSSMSTTEIKSELTKLKELDSDFDQQKFKTHSKKVFMAVQKGWTKRDQEVCRAFMAEEVYQSHQMQIDNMLDEKIINKLTNIVVGSMDFARVDLDNEYHKITMKVRASMKDYKVHEDKPNTVIEGAKTQSPTFTEYWVFIRKASVKTKAKDGIMDKKCPNCGAPIDVSVAGVCKYCDANIVNGDHDWILSEIIQKSEWNG